MNKLILLILCWLMFGAPLWADPLGQNTPAGYTIPDDTLSPNHHYGVTVPQREHADEIDNPRNELVEIKTGRVLTVIHAETEWDYNDMIVPPRWSSDGSLLLWDIEANWCQEALVLLKIENGRVRWKIDLLKTAQQAILTRTRKAKPQKYLLAMKENTGNGSDYPDGFVVNVFCERGKRDDPVSLPLRVHALLTSSHKGEYPENAELDSRLEAVVDRNGKFTVTDFYLGTHKPTLTQHLNRSEIKLGDAAMVNITLTDVEEGDLMLPLQLPKVDGLTITRNPYEFMEGTLNYPTVIRTFILTPTREGNFTIPAFDVATQEGGSLHTQPIALNVTANPRSHGPAGTPRATQPTATATGPVAGQTWTNSLGVKFVPAGTDGVLFSVWDVRVQDFQAYTQSTGYQQTGGITVMKMKTAANGSMGLVGELDPNANWEHPGFEQGPTHPVVGVSWNDAKAFCQWLTKKEQSEGKLAANQQYRLPTDVEWRMAMGWKESSDDKPEMLIGHIIGIRSKNQPTRAVGWEIGTSPVGGSAANSNGLYDLGNVWEWCEDGFYANAYRVARRAWWSRHDPEFLLGSMSTGFNQSDHRNDVAFRVVVVVSP